MLNRAIQTNEAARCAVLLPVLCRLDGPLALVEVGASAGLCLYPDGYSYAYTHQGHTTEVHQPAGPSPVVLPCDLRSGTVPARVPDVAWRAGLDLNPQDVTNAEDLAWLDTLVWPEHDERRRRLRLAAQIAAREPTRIAAGSLSGGVDPLIAAAPADAHVVVFHSAVLVYVDWSERGVFAPQMAQRSDLTWISYPGVGHSATLDCMPIRHIAEASGWERARQDGVYDRSTRGASIEDVGFLHGSAGRRQVDLVLRTVYADATDPLVLLTLDEGALAGAGLRLRLVLEPGDPRNPDGEWFPHVYGGPIPVGAVASAEPIDRSRFGLSVGSSGATATAVTGHGSPDGTGTTRPPPVSTMRRSMGSSSPWTTGK